VQPKFTTGERDGCKVGLYVGQSVGYSEMSGSLVGLLDGMSVGVNVTSQTS